MNKDGLPRVLVNALIVMALWTISACGKPGSPTSAQPVRVTPPPQSLAHLAYVRSNGIYIHTEPDEAAAGRGSIEYLVRALGSNDFIEDLSWSPGAGQLGWIQRTKGEDANSLVVFDLKTGVLREFRDTRFKTLFDIVGTRFGFVTVNTGHLLVTDGKSRFRILADDFPGSSKERGIGIWQAKDRGDAVLVSVPAADATPYGGPAVFYEVDGEGRTLVLGTDDTLVDAASKLTPNVGAGPASAHGSEDLIAYATGFRVDSCVTANTVSVRSSSDWKDVAPPLPQPAKGHVWVVTGLEYGLDGRLLVSLYARDLACNQNEVEMPVLELKDGRWLPLLFHATWAKSGAQGQIATLSGGNAAKQPNGYAYVLTIWNRDGTSTQIADDVLLGEFG